MPETKVNCEHVLRKGLVVSYQEYNIEVGNRGELLKTEDLPRHEHYFLKYRLAKKCKGCSLLIDLFVHGQVKCKAVIRTNEGMETELPMCVCKNKKEHKELLSLSP